MRISPEASRKVENMSLLCAIFVVTIHVGWSDQVGSTGWLIREIMKYGISDIAVPFFFVVSGFFLSSHFNENGWWPRETRKRIFTLVFPFFLWTVLSIMSGWPLSIAADIIAHRPFGTSIYLGLDEPLRSFGIDLSYYPHLGPLWYVRCLFIFVVVSPLLKWLVDKFSCAWLLLLFVSSMLISFNRTLYYCDRDTNCPLAYLICGISVRGMFYFSLGILIEKMGWRKTSRKLAIGCLLLGCELLAFKTALSYNGTPMPIPFVPFILYGIWHYMPAYPLPRFLRGCSFPIFLMHIIVIYGYIGFLMGKMAIAPCATVRSLIYVFFGTIIPIIVCNFLRRYFPRTAKILFCGRV